MHKNANILIIATGILMLSILLMIIILPGVYTRSLPEANNPNAVIGITLAIIVRLLILLWYRSIIKKTRRDGEKRKVECICIGILLIILGLIYSEGAFAFLNNENIVYVPYLMFTSIFCDFIASLLTFIAAFSKSRKIN